MQMASPPKVKTSNKLTAEKVKDRAIKRGKGQNENTTTMGPGGYNFGAGGNKPAQPKKVTSKIHVGGSKPKAPPFQYSGY